MTMLAARQVRLGKTGMTTAICERLRVLLVHTLRITLLYLSDPF